MSQNEQGVLYPFRLSGSRMRRSAAELRRHGQVVDALILVRRAAEQEDTPSAWFALAQELRLLPLSHGEGPDFPGPPRAADHH